MYFDVDISDPDNELTRLIDGLTGQDTHEFDSKLAWQFMQTQQKVHVDTYSLKHSGRMDSKHTKTKWEGEIIYGGPSPDSVYDPVEYAQDEYGRGGDHDFLEPVKQARAPYVEPMLDFLKGKQHGHVKRTA